MTRSDELLTWACLLALLVLVAGCGSTTGRPQASAWCAVDKPPEGVGCDFGTAVPVAAWEVAPDRYVAPVGLVGAKTAGAGLALSLARGETFLYGLGAGWACPWSLDDGLDTGRGAWVVGATVSLNPKREED